METKEFVHRFGEVLVDFGFEPDNSWVSTLRQGSSAQIPESRVRGRA
jgi:hypothetical protein